MSPNKLIVLMSKPISTVAFRAMYNDDQIEFLRQVAAAAARKLVCIHLLIPLSA